MFCRLIYYKHCLYKLLEILRSLRTSYKIFIKVGFIHCTCFKRIFTHTYDRSFKETVLKVHLRNRPKKKDEEMKRT